MTNNANGKFLFLDPTTASAVANTADTCDEAVAYDPAEAFAAITRSLEDAGYDPVTQLTAYLIADDPTYLPEETDARTIARHVGRDKLLEALLAFYLEHRDHVC